MDEVIELSSEDAMELLLSNTSDAVRTGARGLLRGAVNAERERCARIADDNAHAECEVAEAIAAAIRKGEA